MSGWALSLLYTLARCETLETTEIALFLMVGMYLGLPISTLFRTIIMLIFVLLVCRLPITDVSGYQNPHDRTLPLHRRNISGWGGSVVQV